jgi:hypothetical protein
MTTNQEIEIIFPENPIKVGEVYYDSWGYDQTNIDFVKVVEVSPSGKTVKVRKMGERITQTTGFMSEFVVPGNEFGELFRLSVRKMDWKKESEEFYLVGTIDGSRCSFWKFDGEPLMQTHDH